MANFYQFFPTLLNLEGGFVDDPDDVGGATNKGITFNTFKTISEALLNIKPTIDNFKNITNNQVSIIYKKIFWDSIKGDEIKDQKVAEIIFDAKVNQTRFAIKLSQRILNMIGLKISIDGIFNDKTLNTLNIANPIRFYNLYKAGRENLYRNRAEKIPSQKKFLRGWLNRLKHFPDLIEKKNLD